MDYCESEDLAAHANDIDRMYETLAAVNATMPRDAYVLDVGGGAGMHAGMLAGRVGRIICTDFADQNARFGGRFVQLLQEKFARNGYPFNVASFEFHAVDATRLIYRDGLFDAIVSFNALEHIPDPDRALDEMLRVLRPGGLLYLTFDPIWTCDTGSHFAHRVTAPWAHLLLDDDTYVAQLRAAGGDETEADEYRHAMNRKRLAVYRAAFDRLRPQTEFLADYEWSGCASPDNPQHPNFTACLALGYTEEELMFRGFAKVIRKPA